ncbi:MAG: TfoX/Sxy family protein [Rubrivivax sp.]|nr:TfoX/Sxy family protein [Rubrivivax sp.]
MHSLELLGSLGDVRARRMFGGFGLYAGDTMVALIAHERLYLKVDDATRGAFGSAGGEPFVHEGARGKATMSYWTVPAEAMDSPALMAPWARLALQAALRAAKRPRAGLTRSAKATTGHGRTAAAAPPARPAMKRPPRARRP